jgi:stage IV sporulation protein FB
MMVTAGDVDFKVCQRTTAMGEPRGDRYAVTIDSQSVSYAVFLIEPPRTQYDINFNLAGVPVRVHPLFWLIAVLIRGIDDFKPVPILIWTAAVFISILVHEFGHAVLIRYFGWRPRITLYAFGGLAAYEPTWHRMWPQVLISFAGPAAGFILAGIVAAAVQASGHHVFIDRASVLPVPSFEPDYGSANLTDFVYDMLEVNILWGLLNLLPIYPLDGGKISHELLNRFNPANGMRQTLMLSIFTAAGMAAVMFFKLDSGRNAIFFLIFAAMNYVELQQLSDRFGGRRW